jgi:formylmethanofuran dehydrogenase subunit D
MLTGQELKEHVQRHTSINTPLAEYVKMAGYFSEATAEDGATITRMKYTEFFRALAEANMNISFSSKPGPKGAKVHVNGKGSIVINPTRCETAGFEAGDEIQFQLSPGQIIVTLANAGDGEVVPSSGNSDAAALLEEAPHRGLVPVTL